MERARPILIYDGVCHLCDGLVRFVIERDPEARFRFAPRQSAAGRAILERFGTSPEKLDAVALVEGDRIRIESDAALRVLTLLGGPWRLLSAFRVVPAPLRDAAYRFVARRRYGWFGRSESCLMPTADVRRRFLLEAGDEAAA